MTWWQITLAAAAGWILLTTLVTYAAYLRHLRRRFRQMDTDEIAQDLTYRSSIEDPHQ